jgi:hypothetical protein
MNQFLGLLSSLIDETALPTMVRSQSLAYPFTRDRRAPFPLGGRS